MPVTDRRTPSRPRRKNTRFTVRRDREALKLQQATLRRRGSARTAIVVLKRYILATTRSGPNDLRPWLEAWPMWQLLDELERQIRRHEAQRAREAKGARTRVASPTLGKVQELVEWVERKSRGGRPPVVDGVRTIVTLLRACELEVAPAVAMVARHDLVASLVQERGCASDDDEAREAITLEILNTKTTPAHERTFAQRQLLKRWRTATARLRKRYDRRSDKTPK